MRLLGVEGVSGPSGSLLAELTAAAFEREDAARRVWLDEQIKAGRTCRECGGRHGWARDAPGLCAACAKYPKKVPCRICGRPTKCSEGACGRHWQRVAKRHPPQEPRGPRIRSLDRYSPAFLDRPVVVLAAVNPHAPGSQPAAMFDLLRKSATVRDFISAGGAARYLPAAEWRGFVRLGPTEPTD